MSFDENAPDVTETLAAFTIQLTPGDPALESTARFDFTKVWSGGMEGTSRGLMLSGGDLQQGNAGYVALEVFDGSIDGRSGSVAFQQFGSMHNGGYELRYEVVPGSGTGELNQMVGKLDLQVENGDHNVRFRYRV